MSGWSWVWMLAMALAAAACGTPPGELSPKQAEVPSPPEGVIVGVAVAGRTPSTAAGYIRKEHEAYLAYRHEAGTSGELLIVREYVPLQGAFAATENGMPVIYRPFAMRMPAGRGEFVSYGQRRTITKTRQESRLVSVPYRDSTGQWRTKEEWRMVTVYDDVTVTDTSPVPAAAFEVVPGKVRYVGRLGMLLHAAGDCSTGRPEVVGENQTRCFLRQLFADSAPEADLAMIRQRFPKLADAEIEVRPVQFGSGSWQDFAQAAGRFGGSL